MIRRLLLAVWLAALVSVFPARAMMAWVDTVETPVDRVIANLTRRLAADTNNASLTYYLGRMHMMAAVRATNVSTLKTNGMPYLPFETGTERVARPGDPALRSAAARAHWTNSIRLLARAVELLPRSRSADNAWLILPANIGHGWALQMGGRTNEAIAQYRAALRIAWAKEVGSKADELVDTVKWSVEARRWMGWQTRPLGPGPCASDEVIRYLLKLLDPKRDKAEIADLKARAARLASMPRAITPVVVPLAPGLGLADLVRPHAAVSFDLDGSGIVRPWGWTGRDAAWLVWDPADRREITSGLQLFGGVTWWVFWRDGYEALSVLDDDGNGALEGAELDGIALWHDADGDGKSTRDEVTPVRAAGITRLECLPQPHATGIPFHPAGVVFPDGPRPTFDWFSPSSPPTTR